VGNAQGPEGGGDHGNLRIGGARTARVAAVDINAVRTLGGEGHGDGDEFFIFYRNRAVGESRLVKGPKGLHHVRRKAVEFAQPVQIFFIIHGQVRIRTARVGFVKFGAEEKSPAPALVD
jgi:hypothetical protein